MPVWEGLKVKAAATRIFIKDILASSAKEWGEVTVAGWVRSVRKSKSCSFVILNDGTCQQNLQIVVDGTAADGLMTGSCILAKGKLVASKGREQAVEMQMGQITCIGTVGEGYPLQKKSSSLEFLRESAHLRPRTNLFGAIFRIRHRLSMATHDFFDKRGFYYLHSPILTTVDAEGAGEMFQVTSLDLNQLPRNQKGEVDYSKDYFGCPSSLCVSGQLEAECFALGMNSVYTFGPTFRAENSNTPTALGGVLDGGAGGRLYGFAGQCSVGGGLPQAFAGKSIGTLSG